MAKPVIFTVSAIWDAEARVWSGHCDDIPAAAEAPTLDELLEKVSQMALDMAPEITPTSSLSPSSFRLRRCAKRCPLQREWRRNSIVRSANCSRRLDASLSGKDAGGREIWRSPNHGPELSVPVEQLRAGILPTPFFARRGCLRHSEQPTLKT